MNSRSSTVRAVMVGIITVLLLILVVQNFWSHPKVALITPYYAVLLTDGQAYFGKLEQLGSLYPVLTDVYYVQHQINPETKEATNTLVKRGKSIGNSNV